MPPGRGFKQPLPSLPDAPAEIVGLNAATKLHPPVGPGPLHRIAQHHDQLDRRVINPDPLHRPWPIGVDRRGLAPHPPIAPIKVPMIRSVIACRPVERLVIKKMNLFHIGEANPRMVAQMLEQRGGAGLLRAYDDEIDPSFVTLAGNGLHWELKTR